MRKDVLKVSHILFLGALLPAMCFGKEEAISRGRKRLQISFESAKVSYPPKHVTLTFFKDERRLDLYAGPSGEKLIKVKSYRVLAASGTDGPKLKEGDEQVPEGIYAIESLNPFSRFHLSLRVNYPSPQDRAQASKEGRRQLGGDIMIHGSFVSIGCVAIGDSSIEEVFALAKDTRFQTWKVLFSPTDFRKSEKRQKEFLAKSDWMGDRYRALSEELAKLPMKP